MNLNELDNFNLSDTINFHKELNPQLFINEKMRPPVRASLMQIAQDFIEFIGVLDIALVDITVSGSNAAYSYTPHSDIDLHLIVDFNQLNNDEIYRELFDAKKYQYNDQHDIKVKGYYVEVYVQSAGQHHASLGEYSVTRDDWNRIPTMNRANLDDTATNLKYQKIRQLALQALAADDHSYVKNVLDILKRYRTAGLEKGGEFGPENLAFKMLRHEGLFDRLWQKKRGHEDRKLSLEQDTTLEEITEEFNNNSRAINEAVKFMYKRNPSIFDRYSFDTIYAGATKLVEDGRIVKGVNTTCDVGVDQIKIEAGKMGFTVTRDGRPPLLRESLEMLEDMDLLELKMSPGRLKSEVGNILQKYTPVIGLEMEVCWPREEGRPEYSDSEITKHTTWDDLEEFFEYDNERSFDSLKQDYENWVLDKGNEWVEQQVEERLNDPRDSANEKIEFMVDNYTLYGEGEEIVNSLGAEEIDNELAKKILLAAEDLNEKLMSSPDNWDEDAEIPPLARLYQIIFFEDSDEAREHWQDKLYDEFYGTEMAFDDEEYTVGAYLVDKNYDTMQTLFWDYSDHLTWPGGGSGEVFDDDIAGIIASELSDMGLEVEVTGEYHSGQHDDSGHRSEWNIEEDTTIDPNEGDAGFEIISPPLDYVQGMGEIGSVVNYLNDNNAYTNSSTGLHINVSVKGVNHEDIDYPKLILMLGDKYIAKQFDREINQYALSALDKLSNVLSTVGRTKSKEAEFAAYLDKMRNKVDKALASSFANELAFDKYTSVHFRENHVEFRAAGGANYLQKFDQVINIINRCIFAYVIAADPEAYKNEYAKKLYKLTSTKAPARTSTTVEAMKLFALAQAQVISKEELMQKLKGLNALRKVQKDITQTAWPQSAKPIMAEEEFQYAINSAAYALNRRWGREINEAPAWFRQQLMYGMKEQMLRLKEAPPNIMKELLRMLADAQEAMLQDPRVYERKVA